MESLYRKYRPQTFADVVGQQHVVNTLQHAVLEGRTSHAYLFCGPRGTGKTTMARLLAKALMCEQGPGQLPDGTCRQCELIAAGEHPDVYELDAASRTGVDSVREEIINSVSYAPTQGNYKVYIIDEVHMLTTAAFNALLKTLEEPPSHVVFVLCTTDPQKIPATILSRVQRFDFRPIGNDDIRRHLAYVCEQEGFTYEEAALDLVCAHARGGMRDALSTLEQLSVFGEGVIALDAAQDMLGAVSGAALEGVVAALARRDVPALFGQVGDLVNAGRDLLQFTRELAAYMRDVYVVSIAGAKPAVLPPAADAQRLQAEANAFGSSDRLARVLTVLGDVSREMGTAPNQRLVLEIAFTRLARPEADLTLESLAERVAELEARLNDVGQPTAAVAMPMPEAAMATPASASSPTVAPTPEVEHTDEPAPAEKPKPRPEPKPEPKYEPQPAQKYEPQPVRKYEPQPEPRPVPQPQPEPAPAEPQPQPSNEGGLDAGALQRAWKQVVQNLLSSIPARGTLLSNAVATSDDGSKLVVSLPKGSTFAMKMLERADVRAIVEGAVAQVFGPRAIVYREGTGTDLQLPRRRKATPRQAPAPTVPTSQTSEPVQVTQPAAPVSQAPAPAAPAAPVIPVAPTSAPQSQPAPSYPMPWDEQPATQPAPAPQVPEQPEGEPSFSAVSAQPAEVPEPYYEQVPYEEMGGYYEPDMSGRSYDPAYEPSYEPYPSEATQSQPAPSPSAPPQQYSEPAPAPQPEPAPQIAPQPEPQQPAATSPVPDEDESSRPEVPTDLPPELAIVLENAFEVFGNKVRATKE